MVFVCLNTLVHTVGDLVDFRTARKHSLVVFAFKLKWLTFVVKSLISSSLSFIGS